MVVGEEFLTYSMKAPEDIAFASRNHLVVDSAELVSAQEDIRRIPRGIVDGPVCMERYCSAKPRIVWVLREVNHLEDSQWDLSEFLCNGLSAYPHWYSTYGFVAKVSRALLENPNCPSRSLVPANDAVDSLRDIAVINVKKTGGGPRTNWRSLRQAAEIFRPIVIRQLLALRPEIVIAAGTADLVPKCLDSSVRILESSHPGQRRVTHAAMYERMLMLLETDNPLREA